MTVEVIDGVGVVTGPVVSLVSVVHPVKTTTVNAAVAAKRNMLRPFTPPHTLAPATAHRHPVSPYIIGNSYAHGKRQLTRP